MLLIVICLIISSGNQEMITAPELPGHTLLICARILASRSLNFVCSLLRKPTQQQSIPSETWKAAIMNFSISSTGICSPLKQTTTSSARNDPQMWWS